MQDLPKLKVEEPQVESLSNTMKVFYLDKALKVIHGTFVSTKIRSSNVLSRNNRNEILRIKSFMKLSPDWDTYGAEAISKESVDKAIAFVKNVDKYDLDIYLVSPGPNGEILVHLKEGKKDIECIFYPDKSKYVMFENDNFINQDKLEVETLNKLIEWLRSNE